MGPVGRLGDQPRNLLLARLQLLGKFRIVADHLFLVRLHLLLVCIELLDALPKVCDIAIQILQLLHQFGGGHCRRDGLGHGLGGSGWLRLGRLRVCYLNSLLRRR